MKTVSLKLSSSRQMERTETGIKHGINMTARSLYLDLGVEPGNTSMSTQTRDQISNDSARSSEEGQ